MKKTLMAIAILILGASTQVNAQSLSSLKTAASLAKSASGNSTVSSIERKLIINELKSKLGLTSSQTPSVTSSVSSYLTGLNKISSLQKTNASAYTSKKSALASTLSSKMKSTLTIAQYAKYLNLAKSTSSSSALSKLF